MTDPSPVRRFIGGMLMAVGALIALLCGLCTGYFEFAFLTEGSSEDALILPLFIGGLPALIGVGLFVFGRFLFKRPAPKAQTEEF